MKIEIPPKAEYLLARLNHAGYKAYIVGGAVRNSVLNQINKKEG